MNVKIWRALAQLKALYENEEKMQNILNLLNISIITSAKNNNITELKFLMTKGADINAIDIIYLNKIVLFLIN